MADETPPAAPPQPAPAPAPAPPAAPAPKPEPAPAPPTLAAVPDHPDGVELLTSGRVRFRIDGAATTLRAPLLGEIKKFRVLWSGVGAETDAEGRERGDLLDAMYEDVRKLWSWAFETLGDHRFPDTPPDEMPGWVFSTQMPGKVFAHWQAVPLLPGA